MEDFKVEAKALEREYRWLEASRAHESELRTIYENDLLRRGETQERIGYCILRAATQAESQGEFKELIGQVAEAYEKAAKLYEGIGDAKKPLAKMLHCRSIIIYIDFWLSDNPVTKHTFLDECYKLEKEALKVHTEAGDQPSIGKTCVTLSNYLSNLLDLTVDTRERVKILEEALDLGERAIKTFTEMGDENGLAEAYLITGINSYDGAMSLESETRIKECRQKASEYTKEAVRLSEKTGDKFLLGRSNVFWGFIEADLGAGVEVALEPFKKALQYGLETRDRRLISEAYDGLAYSINWKIIVALDLENAEELSKQAIKYANEAINNSTLVDYGRGIPHAYITMVGQFRILGFGEIKKDTRREILLKAVAMGKKGLNHAQRASSTHATYHILASLANMLSSLATVETGVDKRKTLEEAMLVSEKTVFYTEQLRPYFMVVRGSGYNSMAKILFELSKLEENPEKKIELLNRSITNNEIVITFYKKHIASLPPRREVLAALGAQQMILGTVLNHQYLITNDKGILRRIIEIYQEAVQNYEGADLPSRAAEAYWQVAVAYDGLGEYLDSASNFESASKQYALSTNSIPQLKNFYADYERYMQAWSEIERARHRHAERRYGEAKEHYDKAAELLGSTEMWRYLHPNYLAWARLEEAEENSRGEQTEEAKELFEQAAKLFDETEASIKARLNSIEEGEEAQMAENLMNASATRRSYCDGRKAMEEARILDRQGDHVASSRKYGKAKESFEKIIDSLETESDRKELRPIMYLCGAWQRMMMAEARDSPALYGEAADLFMQAKDHAIDQRTSLLAQAHSSFCKALEIGTEYEMTRETGLYSTAKRHIEAASSYYLRAGFQSASDYTIATNRLLDAYMYMYSAQTETEPGQKARLYQLAERLLQSSAGSYIKAKHPEKSEEVRRVLDQIKEEKQIAMALTEILHAPSIVSTTSSFSMPTPTHEAAVGLERFQDADVQANMIVSGNELKVGEDFNLEIKLVNAGKAPAQLIKVEDIIPAGFEIKEAPDFCRVEDNYIDMKGRTLPPLKTTELKLVMRPMDKGMYRLNPRVLYLDESGKYRSHEPDPTTVTVKDMGITGWLKGPPR